MHASIPRVASTFASHRSMGIADLHARVEDLAGFPFGIAELHTVYGVASIIAASVGSVNTLIVRARSLVYWTLIVATTLFWGTLSLLSTVVRPDGDLSYGCMKYWSKSILFFCGMKVLAEGQENISSADIQIFASNHQSFFDVWALASIIPVKFGWLGKKEVARVPILGMHMKKNGYIIIDRSNREKAIESMDKAAQAIKGGNRIAIFPEGTRSCNGQMGRFKKGLFHLCLKTMVPLVPIYISGTGRALRPGSMVIRPGIIKIRIGKPFATVGYDKCDIDPLMVDFEKVMRRLEAGVFTPKNESEAERCR